jgi:anti-sigma factor RsiW
MLEKDIVERLLMDHALGRLEPDVAALLRAYVNSDPTLKAEAQAFTDVASLAQHALEEAEPVSLPPLAATLPGSRRKAQGMPWRVAGIVAAAACLAFGIAIGRWTSARAPVIVRPAPEHGGPESAEPSALALAKPRKSETVDFWSTRRLFNGRLDERRPRGANIEWLSPVVTPRLSSKGDL